MSQQAGCTLTLTFEQSPEDVFRAVTDVRGWWSTQIEGETDRLGGVFEFRHEDLHRSTHEIVAYVPGEKLVWRTIASQLTFVDDEAEWTGTEIVFEIEGAPNGPDRTELRFTHVGLVPTIECYGACSAAWAFYITDSLRSLITTGRGKPAGLALAPRTGHSSTGSTDTAV